MFDSSELILNAFFEAFTPVIELILMPVFLWIMIPGLVTRILFKRKDAYIIGAFLGLIGMFMIGPYSSSSFL
ncbi:hypothetical protein [Mesobacillus jeotgali]|uniref:hypothetical protein n=1 Tax=Mesobacillus jeotgali TaxID=129985 RepID=UPI001CFF12C9|nr:hypothetical protein [Mesobacillus jeotgali]